MKTAATIIRLQDKWNSQKVWIIKRYADGHFYLNQEINGKLFYARWTKTSRSYLENLFSDGKGFYLNQIKQEGSHFLESCVNHKGKTVDLRLWFDDDETFFRIAGSADSIYTRARHNSARVGNMALAKDGTWKRIRA